MRLRVHTRKHIYKNTYTHARTHARTRVVVAYDLRILMHIRSGHKHTRTRAHTHTRIHAHTHPIPPPHTHLPHTPTPTPPPPTHTRTHLQLVPDELHLGEVFLERRHGAVVEVREPPRQQHSLALIATLHGAVQSPSPPVDLLQPSARHVVNDRTTTMSRR